MCNHRLNLARIFFIRSIRLVRESMDKIACVFLLAMKNRFDRYMAHAFPWRIGQNLKSNEEQLKKVMNFTFSGKFLHLILLPSVCLAISCFRWPDSISTVHAIYSKRTVLSCGLNITPLPLHHNLINKSLLNSK